MAKGRIPLADGNYIDLAWTKNTNLKYTFKLLIPNNIKAFILIPEAMENRRFRINDTYYKKHSQRIPIENGNFELEFFDDSIRN